MQTIIRPQAGDIGLTDITGPVGWGIWLGQAATGDFSWKEHALVVTGDFGECIEAVPPRARRGSIGRYDPRTVVYLRVPMTKPERYAVARHAELLVNTEYSFAQYPALALLGAAQWVGQDWRPKRLTDYIESSGRMICSQLVDEAFLRAGIHLFDDDRAPGDVTPGDLWRLGHHKGWVLAA